MRQLTALLFALCLVPLASAQSSLSTQTISESEARQHLADHTDPIYPPIAKAAHIQGDVVIKIVIDNTGAIKSEKVISGPAMLQQAALDAVKKWHFTPFETNGSAAEVTSTLTIPFQIDKPGEGPSPGQLKAAQAFFPLADKCRAALRRTSPQEAVNACKSALDMSFKAGDLTNSDQLGRLNAHQYYGHALLMANRPQDALEQENLAVQEAKKCLTETDEEYGMPLYWRAITEARLGQADPAIADFQAAEAVHRKAIAHLPEMKKIYSQYLASILKTHAAVLDQLGRSSEADKLRSEAASL